MTHKVNPPGLKPPDSKEKTAVANTEDNNLKRLVWVLSGFVAALTLVVLVLLPAMVAERPAAETAAELKPAIPNQPPVLAVSVARDDAEQALKEFLRLRAQPGLANAQQWAADDWQRALKTAVEGDGLYGRGRFTDAIIAYKDATQQLQALLDGRPQRLTDALAAGWLSLQKNDADTAISAFERVLAMQPDHEEASVGLTRALVRNEVLRLMAAGSQAEMMNILRSADEAYRAALQLDAAYVPAQTAAERVSQSLAEEAFQRAMSAALQNLDRGRLNAAAKALQTAAKIHPESAAVNDVQRRLLEAQRRFRFTSLRRQAEQKAVTEDWSAVAELNRNALAIDGRSVAARNGLAYAENRMRVNSRFDHYLSDTTRLSSDEPLANARKLLQANSKVSNAEPRLADKISRLQEAVRLALIPVKLRLLSDGQTDVAIYQVGRFGRFQQKELTLRPGRYTIAGSCTGYRDIRKVILLRPESGAMNVTIRCEEKI